MTIIPYSLFPIPYSMFQNQRLQTAKREKSRDEFVVDHLSRPC